MSLLEIFDFKENKYKNHINILYKKKNAIIISTKDPTKLLLDNIDKYKLYYKDFDIIIIDSNSTDTNFFNDIPSDVIIDYAKNKNYVLGAWKYAINKYDYYDLYLFVQDSLVPLKRIDELDTIQDFSNIMFDIPYSAEIGLSYDKIDLKHLERLHDTYKNTKFEFINDIPATNIIKGTAHTSFLLNKKNSQLLFELEDIYIKTKFKKEKIDCCLSERTIGILADHFKLNRYPMTQYFNKLNMGRK